jgi:hypothetical protein
LPAAQTGLEHTAARGAIDQRAHVMRCAHADIEIAVQQPAGLAGARLALADFFQIIDRAQAVNQISRRAEGGIGCKSWLTEAAYRMIQNNLDPEVAERPQDLVVYGGRGQAARSWEAFDAILDTLRELEDDETLLVQSGKPVAVFKSHPMPRAC